MLIGIFHEGSGLGNQLARYVMTRGKALDMGVEFGMVGNFKGDSFMKIDKGVPVPFTTHVEYPAGKVVVDCDWPIYQEDPWNPDYSFKVDDNTIIDGEFQGEKYFEHRRKEIDEWLKVEPLDMPDDLCIIGFRGGEYLYTDWFLPFEYWENAMNIMRQRGVTRFKIVTDDPSLASKVIHGVEVTHEIGMDWRQIRYAKNLIIANSSFYILPAWLNEQAYVIAPMHWAGHNKGEWHLGQNEYAKFHYLDKQGNIT
jgi:hypothetical protein